jgi:cyclopropane fatty-acyl-phospholipid synthase-like methyltransferase
MTDFGQMKKYADYIKDDPFRRGLHYPAVEEVLGDLNKKRILDVGCGDGLFPRLLAERGASVVGYEKAPEKIVEARGHKDAQRLDVKYVAATQHTFSHDGEFDAATSVMVLPYATSLEDLTAFFRSTGRHLIAGGRFASVVLNPSFSAFATDFFVRRITKLQGNKVRIDFLDQASGNVEMTMEQHQYTKQEYERAAVAGGMKPEAWEAPFAMREAVEQIGKSFWQPCHEHQPYALFIARKE